MANSSLPGTSAVGTVRSLASVLAALFQRAGKTSLGRSHSETEGLPAHESVPPGTSDTARVPDEVQSIADLAPAFASVVQISTYGTARYQNTHEDISGDFGQNNGPRFTSSLVPIPSSTQST